MTSIRTKALASSLVRLAETIESPESAIAPETPLTSEIIIGPGPYFGTDGDDIHYFSPIFTSTFTYYAQGGNDEISVVNGVVANLYGELGDDYLYAAGAGSYLDGGDGDDALFAIGGSSTLLGGAGNDYLNVNNTADGINRLNGGAGDDYLEAVFVGTAILIGGDGNDLMVGGDDGSTTWFFGDAGDDWIMPRAGLAVILGGDGFDTVNYGLMLTGVSINLTNQHLNAGGAAGQTLDGIERYLLSHLDDNFIGSDAAELVNGREGRDVLQGLGGDDTLDGGDDGDWLDGGAGADTLTGGDGFDVASYLDAAAGIGIDLTKASATWTGDAQGDVFSSIEEIELSNFADTFRGDANANTVAGGDGNDQIFGAAGDDELLGGSGNDIIQGGDGNDFVSGVDGDDYLQGNAGDDVLAGNDGNDRMVGGTGNDRLYSGLGGDFLVGNEGSDIFKYSTVEESQNVLINGVSQLDQISDFTQGQDKIDLSAIDGNPALAGNQTFTFIADPTHYTGDWTGVVWQTTAANGIVTVNVSIDGDADAEMQIYMSHPYQLTANDFIL